MRTSVLHLCILTIGSILLASFCAVAEEETGEGMDAPKKAATSASEDMPPDASNRAPKARIWAEEGTGTVEVEQRPGLGYDVPDVEPSHQIRVPDYGPIPDPGLETMGGDTAGSKSGRARFDVPPGARIIEHGRGQGSVRGGQGLNPPPEAEIIERGRGSPSVRGRALQDSRGFASD